MLYVALAAIAALAVSVVSFAGLLRSQARAHARREEAILNKLLHAVGTPWQTAPADTYAGTAGSDDATPRAAWTTNPEQEL